MNETKYLIKLCFICMALTVGMAWMYDAASFVFLYGDTKMAAIGAIASTSAVFYGGYFFGRYKHRNPL